jgi:nucleotide-binding universal stress UspA family protein
MYRHVLVPLDRSTQAEVALEAAFHVAEANGARVSLLSVLERLPTDFLHTDTQDDQWKQRGKQYLGELVKRLPPHNFPVDTFVRLGLPAREIVSFVEASDVDLVVIATHGSSRELEHPMGSTTWKVLHRSPCPVLLVRASMRHRAAKGAAKGAA